MLKLLALKSVIFMGLKHEVLDVSFILPLPRHAHRCPGFLPSTFFTKCKLVLIFPPFHSNVQVCFPHPRFSSLCSSLSRKHRTAEAVPFGARVGGPCGFPSRGRNRNGPEWPLISLPSAHHYKLV